MSNNLPKTHHRLDAEHVVRQATSSDIPRIAEIWKQGVGQAFGPAPKRLPSDEAIANQFECLVAQQDDNFKFWLCLSQTGEVVG